MTGDDQRPIRVTVVGAYPRTSIFLMSVLVAELALLLLGVK